MIYKLLLILVACMHLTHWASAFSPEEIEKGECLSVNSVHSVTQPFLKAKEPPDCTDEPSRTQGQQGSNKGAAISCSYLEALPEEILYKITFFLDALSLGRLAQASRQLKMTSYSACMWRELLKESKLKIEQNIVEKDGTIRIARLPRDIFWQAKEELKRPWALQAGAMFFLNGEYVLPNYKKASGLFKEVSKWSNASLPSKGLQALFTWANPFSNGKFVLPDYKKACRLFHEITSKDASLALEADFRRTIMCAKKRIQDFTDYEVMLFLTYVSQNPDSPPWMRVTSDYWRAIMRAQGRTREFTAAEAQKILGSVCQNLHAPAWMRADADFARAVIHVKFKTETLLTDKAAEEIFARVSKSKKVSVKRRAEAEHWLAILTR